MMKKLLTLILLISQLSFSQVEKDNYKLYTLILNQHLELGNKTKKEKIVLIEKLENFDNNIEFLDHKSDTITQLDLDMLYSMTHKDSVFIKRVSKEGDLRNVIIELTSYRSDHPKIKSELLKKKSIEIQTITNKIFNSFFRSNRRIEKSWKRIKKKYGTQKVIGFSKVNYNGQFATIYYSINCGSLCGSGNIVVFEIINKKWQILTEINLWMS
ncbi:hypothetical protein [Tenacibaculum halocynthiae]|uniref:hypothetical protein n=1 Tax=Tenacibaculum halocynthiae TaxID=1254437 RepID=UPI003D6590C4